MNHYMAIYNASGEIYYLEATDDDAAYRQLAREVLRMSDTEAPNFDTGNVDFDLRKLPTGTSVPVKVSQ